MLRLIKAVSIVAIATMLLTGCAAQQTVKVRAVVLLAKEKKDFKVSADETEPVKCMRVPDPIFSSTGTISWNGKTYDVQAGSEVCLKLKRMGNEKQQLEKDGVLLAEEDCYRCTRANDAFVSYVACEEKNIDKNLLLLQGENLGDYYVEILSPREEAGGAIIQNVRLDLQESPSEYHIVISGPRLI
jgi:hypothetical protein